MIPFIGQVDDAYLIAITLLRLMDQTDPEILREHWSGGGDIVQLIEAVASVSAKLLPRRIRRILTARVKVNKVRDKRKLMSSPLLVADLDDVKQAPSVH